MFYYEAGILRILHFQKILFLSKEKIEFQMKKFHLSIEGKNLILSSFYDEETCVNGCIERIVILS